MQRNHVFVCVHVENASLLQIFCIVKHVYSFMAHFGCLTTKDKRSFKWKRVKTRQRKRSSSPNPFKFLQSVIKYITLVSAVIQDFNNVLTLYIFFQTLAPRKAWEDPQVDQRVSGPETRVREDGEDQAVGWYVWHRHRNKSYTHILSYVLTSSKTQLKSKVRPGGAQHTFKN